MEHNKIKAVIEGISKKDKRADGTPYIDKNGKAFTIVSIKLSDDLINDKEWKGWCTIMDYNNEFDLNKGDTIEGTISKNVVGDATYWNFREPSRVDKLEERVERLENMVFSDNDKDIVAKDLDKEEDDDEIDLPF